MFSLGLTPRSGDKLFLRFALLFAFAVSLPLRSQDPPSSQAPAPSAAAPATAPTQPQSPSSEKPSPASASPAKPSSEVSMQDSGPTFKLRVNLVQVHVVIRDSHDKPVENLKKEDFQLFDQGKPQVITNFSVETPASRRERALAAARTQTATDANQSAAPDPNTASLPERYIAL